MKKLKELDLVINRIPSAATEHRPFVIAIDGRGGTGKSTFAATFRDEVKASLIDTDDFYVGDADWDTMPVEQRWDRCIDWRQLSQVLDELRAGHSARWGAYNWETDGEGSPLETQLDPCRIVVIEGTFSGRPELGHRVDLRVLLRTTPDNQQKRFTERESPEDWLEWSNTWMASEDHYFHSVMPPEQFDIVIDL